jgi:hypothetical protein
MQIQVDEAALRNKGASEASESVTLAQPEDVLLDLVKEHAIDVFTRLNPSPAKRSY